MANEEACLAGLLIRGEGASRGEAVVSRSLVLLAGLVCVEWVVGLLEWLVFGLGTAALLGELLATGVFDRGGRAVVDDAVGLACVSLEA
jgi:type IV secretory pathway TrbD component